MYLLHTVRETEMTFSAGHVAIPFDLFPLTVTFPLATNDLMQSQVRLLLIGHVT